MLRKLHIALIFCLTILAVRGRAQTPNNDAAPAAKSATTSTSAKSPNSVESRVERFLRDTYAWGPSFDVKVEPAKPSPIADLLALSVTIRKDQQSDTAIVYVDKSGKFLLRGELADMTVDPLADTKSKLIPGNSPSTGPDNAKVTLIEFADFECPSCRQLDRILRPLIAQHPEYRLVFKDFTLTDLHPWAMTAAIAAQCSYQQSPTAFWKIHDAIFDAQDVISASNVWDKMIDLATQQGLDIDKFRTCMADPAVVKQIEQTEAEGHALNITATPTIYINGRKIVGADESLLEQFVSY